MSRIFSQLLLGVAIFGLAFTIFTLIYSAVNKQSNLLEGKVKGLFTNLGGKYQPQVAGWGGGLDLTAPTSMITDLSDYYNSVGFPASLTGSASDASGIASLDLRIQRNSDNYYWNQSSMSWQMAEVWNNASGTDSWSWSTSSLVGNLANGIQYTLNSRAIDSSANANLEDNITDEDSQEIFTFDSSGPTAPATVNDGTGSDVDSTNSNTQLSANWTVSSDSGSGLAKYQYAIGSSSGATDVVSWTDNGTNISVTKTGLSLNNSQIYYFSVRAVDNLGNIGSVNTSDGIKVEVVTNTSSGTETNSNSSSNSNSQDTATTSIAVPSTTANQSISQVDSGSNNQEVNFSNSSALTQNQETDSMVLKAAVDGVEVGLAPDQTITTLPASKVELAIKPSLESAVESLEASFQAENYHFSDPDEDGYYSTEVLTPAKKGLYELEARLTYLDQSQEKIQVQILVDPYGYVYRKFLGILFIRLSKVKINLYVKNDEQWQLWNAQEYDQLNPQPTNKLGEYRFLLPAGQYYLTAEKKGYYRYRSARLRVEDGQPVNLNIELIKKPNYWLLVLLLMLLSWPVKVKYYHSKE